jgi:uncharacterized protein (TIGR02266 family)
MSDNVIVKGATAMQDEDRRSNQRVPGKYEINFINEGDYLISFSKDISVDGMFIRTDNPPPVGETTQLTFSIGDIEQISVDAKIVWVNDSESSGDPGMGVQFINPPARLKDTILSIVKRVAVLQP